MANLIKILMIYIVLLELKTQAYYDFCEVRCKNPKNRHILCLREQQNCSHHERCDPSIEYFNLTQRQFILDAMNDLRNQLALGQMEPFPKAANMKVLRWCFELEYMAQCLTNMCDDDIVLKACADTRNYPTKTLSHEISYAEGATDAHIKEIFTNWFDRMKNTTKYPLRLLKDNDFEGVDYLLNLIACHRVNRMGCGVSKDKSNEMYIICVFSGPRRPWSQPCPLHDPIYIQGKPCSRCEASACNEKYRGLCGESVPIDMELGNRYRADDIISSRASLTRFSNTVISRHEEVLLLLIFIIYFLF